MSFENMNNKEIWISLIKTNKNIHWGIYIFVEWQRQLGNPDKRGGDKNNNK